MQITLTTQNISQTQADMILLLVKAGFDLAKNDDFRALDKLVSGRLGDLIKRRQFNQDQAGGSLVVDLDGRDIGVIVAPKTGLSDSTKSRLLAGEAVSLARSHKAQTIVVKPLGFAPESLIAGALSEGLELGEYRYGELKTTVKLEPLAAILYLNQVDDDVKRLVASAQIKTRAQKLVRDLVNRPANHLANETLGELAQSLGSERIKVRIQRRKDLERLGAGGILAVNQGSSQEPLLIELTYTPGKPSAKPDLYLVGKGVTFDTGGLGLKSSVGMSDMKLDMAGAGTVLGVFSALESLDAERRVVGVIPVVENAVSATSFRPGDVIKTMSGKTLEIGHTDCEGRIILADALTQAQNLIKKSDRAAQIIDLATLTEACVVALGEQIAGLMGNDEDLLAKIKTTAGLNDELIWPLPLPEQYLDQTKSEIADLANNHKSRYGGTMLAGLLLEQFIDPGQPWAHIDLAGPSYAAQPFDAVTPHGGTGYGVRTLIDLARE